MNLTSASPPGWCSSWASDYGMFFTIPNQANATDNNLGVMTLFYPFGGSTPTGMPAQQWAEQAKFYLGDRHPPTVSYTPPASSGTWTDDEGASSHTDALSATDQGLSVKYFWQSLNGVITPYTRSCSGIRGANSCTAPTSWSTRMPLQSPEGESTMSYAAFDQTGQASVASQTYTALIDRTPPDMSLEGPLIDQRVAIGNNGVYDLTVEADDGAGRSGVEAIEIFVDSNKTETRD